MKLLGIAGPDDEAATLAERIADRLGNDVALVERTHDSSEPNRRAETIAPTRYEIADDGSWIASGTDRSLWGALDELAPEHEYALLVGFPDADVPTVVLGDGDPAGEVVETAADADDADVSAAVEAIEDAEPHETLGSLVERAKRSPDAEKSGAIATFTGRVRAKDDDEDEPTEYLEFETYDGVADERMATIREELEEREGVYEVLMHHRTGVVEYGEDIVFVVVLAGHRPEAFRTVEDGIDRLKDEVPIFKKEVTVEEEFWVHTR